MLLSKDAATQVTKDMEARQKELEDQRLKREQLERERTEREEKAKRDQAAQAEKERLAREARRQFESQAASRCDELAGNPTDPNRSGNGVSYDMLKPQAEDAVANCELAVQQSPNELRFQYQLARALQFADHKRALEIQTKLVGLHYPAAYDNLGWLVFVDRKDIPAAVNYFRMGTQLGDPDLMVSVAEMIDRGYYTPQSQSETKIELYGRAAALGSSAAAQSLAGEQKQEATAEQDRARLQEQQRLMLQMLGGVLQGIHR